MGKAGAHGCFAVKANQKGLLQACQRRSRYPASDTHTSIEPRAGGAVERITRTWAIPPKPRHRRGFWPAFAMVVKTTRIRHHPHRAITREVAWHVLTASLPAQAAAALVRGHWSIENNLHGTRDLRFHEDACTATGATAIGYAWLRTLAHNTLQALGLRPTRACLDSFHDFNLLAATVRP